MELDLRSKFLRLMSSAKMNGGRELILLLWRFTSSNLLKFEKSLGEREAIRFSSR